MRSLLVVLVFLYCHSFSFAQEVDTGLWRGVISYDQADVPFTFQLSKSDLGNYVFTIINGEEAIPIINTRWEQDSLVIPMHAFDAEIKAKVSKDHMSGRWVKHYKKSAGMPFSADFNKPRFTVSLNSQTPQEVPDELKMVLTPTYSLPYQTIGLFNQRGNLITGTILAEVGDFRYFEGVVIGDSLMATSFDGAHAFMLVGHYEHNVWTGELIFDNNYAEPWVGSIDPTFSLTDPFVEIDPSDTKKQEPFFDILTAGSEFNSLNKDDFLGHVTIIQLLGSWCPNSLDETNYLTQWYELNNQRDVDVLAVFFELNYSKAYGMQRMNDYVAQNHIAYNTTLGGPANKGQAALAFPFINKIKAFPTLMILDKSGHVRYMHTYFQGPATGPYYDDFDGRFNAIIDELLAEL